MTDWEPIDTAPKGNVTLLVWANDGPVIAWRSDYSNGVTWWFAVEGGCEAYHLDAVTHWAPLPEAPVLPSTHHKES
jgi:hypothetical protein